ncbi:MAG: class I SAM-dependent methyltransferase [Proteobacteria bacterium]|nr:class I SAM-dependent methyltransferase [Pseudomonadota bacterium]
MPDWFDDDELWTTARLAMFPPTSFAAAPAEVAALFELCGHRPRPALDVLDLPCGPGRHTVCLQRAGHRVVAVDRTDAYLEELRVRALDRVEVVQADMRDFVRPDSFDLAINLFTSFGFFEDLNDDRQVLRNFHASLRPGGHLVIDLMGREVLARIIQPKRFQRLADGTVLLCENRVVDGWSWMEGTWTYIRDGHSKVIPFGHRLWTGSELRRELRDAGFADVQLFGGFDGSDYDHEARRLVAVARK